MGTADDITVTALCILKSKGLPIISQTVRVISPPSMAIIVSHRAARLATSWVCERLSGPAHHLDHLGEICFRPVFSDDDLHRPSPLTAPDELITGARGPTGQRFSGKHRRVTLLSLYRASINRNPFSRFHRTRSSGWSRLHGYVTDLVAGQVRRWACAGRSSTSFSSAREAPITERISNQWPRSMMSIKGGQLPEEDPPRLRNRGPPRRYKCRRPAHRP